MYIYIQRERERDTHTHKYTQIHTHDAHLQPLPRRKQRYSNDMVSLPQHNFWRRNPARRVRHNGEP